MGWKFTGGCAVMAFPTLCEMLQFITGQREIFSSDPFVWNDIISNLHTPPPPDGLKVLRASVSIVSPPITKIRMHSHPVQGRIRLNCPLLVPDGSTPSLIFPGQADKSVYAEEGKCFWFDESMLHTLHYEGQQERAVL